MALPTDTFRPLSYSDQMATMIAEITGCDPALALARLESEYRRPGSSVGDDFRKSRLRPYTWNDDLLAFYSRTDGFLYELAIWNRNKIKKRMRENMVRWLQPLLEDSPDRRPSRILTIGDGLGFDSLALSQAGHEVTYFDLPGLTQRFASSLFARSLASIPVVTDLDAVAQSSFDVVVCLDVLEHVPDPGSLLQKILRPLREDGCLVVHAPFHMVLPPFPTHLRENRRYAGSLSFYRRNGLKLLGGSMIWTPLLFARKETPSPRLKHPCPIWRQLGIQGTGLVLSLGRVCSFPFWFFVLYQRMKKRWFRR